MSRYVGVHGQGDSADWYNVYLFALFLGEKIVEATGNETLCEDLGKNNTVRAVKCCKISCMLRVL